MESYKCGTHVSAAFCQDVTSYYWDKDKDGHLIQNIRCAHETISTTRRNEYNPEYGNPDYAKDPEKPGQMNQVSAVILTPTMPEV